MKYIDAYVLPVPKKNIADYTKIAKIVGKIWIEHGALQYIETVMEDPRADNMVSFPQMMDLKEEDTAVVAYVVYKSRKIRDKVNAKVMADPRLAKMFKEMKVPFNPKQMTYGGFTSIVDL